VVSIGALFLSRALNAVFEVEETRPTWKRVASSLTFAPGLDEAFVQVWTLLRWPTALILLALVVAAVYRYAPNVDLTFRSVLLGALVAMLFWGLVSLAFSFFLTIFPVHGVAYESLGTAISLLLYLYLSAAVLLFGAELNAQLRRDATKGGGAKGGA
jgi:membrane protein